MNNVLRELTPGAKVTDYFACTRKAVRVDRNGNKFLSLQLTDAGGTLPAVMWDVSDAIAESFAERDVVKVQGTITSDNFGKPQLKLERIRAAGDDDELDPARLLPASPRDPALMEAELAELRQSIANSDITALLDEIFGDEVLYRSFCEAPAAKGFHHNYIYGLLEHSLSVSRVADAIAGQYPEANRDLLIAGAILHDLGKIIEFDYATSIDYSDKGRLLGHIILGERIVSDAIHRLDSFPTELELQLLHLILSHHGEYAYGSPRRPKTLEAFLLHQADDIDAKANVFHRLRESGEPWSDFNRVLERFLYLRPVEE